MKYLFILLSSLFFMACSPAEKPSEKEILPIEEEYIDSLKFLSENIQNNSKDATTWSKRANYFFRLGNLKDAKRDYEEAILRDSTNAQYRTRYGDVLVAFLDLSGAKYNYEYAIEMDSLCIF